MNMTLPTHLIYLRDPVEVIAVLADPVEVLHHAERRAVCRTPQAWTIGSQALQYYSNQP